MKYSLVIALLFIPFIHATAVQEKAYADMPDMYEIVNYTTPVCNIAVIKGELIDLVVDPEPFTTARASYEVKEVTKGQFENGVVQLTLDATTLPASLPASAILIITRTETNIYNRHITYYPLGKEAWRGILPYSDELWDKIRNMSIEEIAYAKEDEIIPPEKAYKHACETVTERRKGAANHIVRYIGMPKEHPTISRLDRGWRVRVQTELDLIDQEIMLLFMDLITVTDNGVILSYNRDLGPRMDRYGDPDWVVLNNAVVRPDDVGDLLPVYVNLEDEYLFIPSENLQIEYSSAEDADGPFVAWLKSQDPNGEYMVVRGNNPSRVFVMIRIAEEGFKIVLDVEEDVDSAR